MTRMMSCVGTSRLVEKRERASSICESNTGVESMDGWQIVGKTEGRQKAPTGLFLAGSGQRPNPVKTRLRNRPKRDRFAERFLTGSPGSPGVAGLTGSTGVAGLAGVAGSPGLTGLS